MQQREQLTGILSARPARFGKSMVVQVLVRIECADVYSLIRVPPPPEFNEGDIESWRRLEDARIEKAWKFVRAEWRDATYEDMRELGYVCSVDMQFKHINDYKEYDK